jgi:hypothetical protein
MTDILQRIQKLQFTQKSEAEALLLTFVSETFDLDVVAVELRPLAVSLNSFNGFLTLSEGRKLFFKTHTEADNVISEYYNATQLAQAGYPVIQPLMSSTEADRQFLIYEVVTDPSVFDVAWAIETGVSEQSEALTEAQHAADNQLFVIYRETLKNQSALEAATAPIHQLFYHRLAGGRLERFYGNETPILLPDGYRLMQEIRQKRWQINGQVYVETLDDIIARSLVLLHPSQAGLSIIGHGDAHNGNIFLRSTPHQTEMFYFDPAFAGRHSPILDVTKPLFHNVFAMWMYFPQIKSEQTNVRLKITPETLQVEHDYALHPIRRMFLESKINRVLIPILHELKKHNQLPSDWRQVLKASLFCCPFLTMNLTDSSKFPPEISLLGLAMTVEMGSESSGSQSLIDQKLDEVASQLG